MSRVSRVVPDARALDHLGEYADGLEAEFLILSELLHLSATQCAACRRDDYAAMSAAAAERDTVATSLDDLEARLAPLRARVATELERVGPDERMAGISARHRDAATLVNRIIEQDRTTVALLEGQAVRRRAVAQHIDTGEVTLAAYRRTIAPSAASAGLLDRRG